MLSVEEASEQILSIVPKMPVVEVSIDEADGMVLAKDLISPINIPPWDNSAMDGFALRAEDLNAESDTTLRIVGMVAAGTFPEFTVPKGCASGIMTGAPMPKGANAVVMVEQSNGSYTDEVVITAAAKQGQNIRKQGGDVTAGAVALAAGTVLTPAAIGMAASLGFAMVPVYRRPVVAILATGDELAAPGTPIKLGQIYASNNVVLAGMVREAGGVALDLGIVPDNLEASVAAIDSAISQADVLLTSGGVSMGEFDFVKASFEKLGAKQAFWKVWMKPGKPLSFGRVVRDGREVALFGLPGNPVSCAVNFLQFTRPFLRTMVQHPRPHLPVVTATASEQFYDRSGRAKFIRVILTQTDAGWVVSKTGAQGSGILSSMVVAHGLLLMPTDVNTYEAGDRVKVQLLSTAFLDRATR